MARSRRVGWAGAGVGIAGLALAGVAGCLGCTVYYLVNYPSVRVRHSPATAATLSPGTAVVFAVLLAGCAWLAVTPPRWLLASRPARRFGVGMAVVLGPPARRGRADSLRRPVATPR